MDMSVPPVPGTSANSKKLCHFTTHPYAGPVGNNRISDWGVNAIVIVVDGGI